MVPPRIGRSVSALTPTNDPPLSSESGTLRSLAASALVAARFLPIWIATAALAIVAAITAPEALQSTSWAFVLPYMTILAVAALGQMLVIMQAGIDLSTPGVISFGGNLIVGVAVGSGHGLTAGLLACLALGAGVGLAFCATALTMTYVWQSPPRRLWAIDTGYHIVGCTIMGAILAVWR